MGNIKKLVSLNYNKSVITFDINQIIEIEKDDENSKIILRLNGGISHTFCPSNKQALKDLYKSLLKLFNDDTDPSVIKEIEVM